MMKLRKRNISSKFFQAVKVSTTVRNALIALYVLIVLGFSASAKADQDETSYEEDTEISVPVFAGQVAMTSQGKFMLVVSETEIYELRSKADLGQFLGQNVLVKGFDIMYQVKPAADDMGHSDPLLNFPSPQQKVCPVLIVYEISET